MLLQVPCFLLWVVTIRRMSLDNHPGFDCVKYCYPYLCGLFDYNFNDMVAEASARSRLELI